jgi:putative membrane protein
MNKRYFLALGLLATTVSLYAANDTQLGINTSSHTVSPAEVQNATTVLADMHRTNLAEIEMGKLAKSQGHSKAMREYGDMLVTDHSNSDKQVKDVAGQLDIALMDKDEAMAGKEHDDMAKLKNTKGAAFDRAFAAAMLKGHKEKIAMLEAAQKQATGPLAGLINQTLPVLKKHANTAQQLSVASPK